MSKRTVLITGAGFSTGFGHPLTRDLVKTGLAILLRSRQVYCRYCYMNWVIRFLLEVERVNKGRRAGGEADIDLEQLLQSIWDSDKRYQNKSAPFSPVWEIPGLSQKQDFGWHQPFGIDNTVLYDGGPPGMLFDLIVWVIREVLWWTGRGSLFAYHRKRNAEIGPVCGVITTNYDLLAEALLGRDIGDLDHGFAAGSYEVVTDIRYQKDMGLVVTSKSQPSTGNPFPILKLHGGLNLAFCPLCKKVLSFPAVYSDLEREDHKPTPWWYFAWEGAVHISPVSHGCRQIPEEFVKRSENRIRPLIAPPMTNKSELEHWPMLMAVHKRAEALIDSCEVAVIIGSAFRQSDGVLRELLLRLTTKSVILYGSENDLASLRTILPKQDVSFRGYFLPPLEVDLGAIPLWGAEPTKEFGEDNPTDEWLRRRAEFREVIDRLRREAGV